MIHRDKLHIFICIYEYLYISKVQSQCKEIDDLLERERELWKEEPDNQFKQALCSTILDKTFSYVELKFYLCQHPHVVSVLNRDL